MFTENEVVMLPEFAHMTDKIMHIYDDSEQMYPLKNKNQ